MFSAGTLPGATTADRRLDRVMAYLERKALEHQRYFVYYSPGLSKARNFACMNVNPNCTRWIAFTKEAL